MRVRYRVFPVLTIKNGGLVKTQKFNKSIYLGDPINAVRIFNEKEVDELVLLDISEDRVSKGPDFTMLKDIVDEAFMPLTYGGGIRSLEEADKLIKMGFEKVLFNSLFHDNPQVVSKIVDHLGSQSVVVSLDYRFHLGKPVFYKSSGRVRVSDSLDRIIEKMNQLEVGEVVIHSIERDGTRNGYDTKMLEIFSNKTNNPVIAMGGAKDMNDIKNAFATTQISAAAAGHMFVFYGKLNGVLINFPNPEELYEDDLSNG